MKIAYITMNPPDYKSGGGIGLAADIEALKENEIDYIGPEISDKNICKIFDRVIELEYNSSISKRIVNFTFHKATSSYFNSWVNVYSKIDWSEYAYVFVERSCYLFVISDLYKLKVKILLRLHNVEADYYLNIYKYNRSITNYIHYKNTLIHEKKALQSADKIVCLTDNDRMRIINKYNIDPRLVYAIPHGYKIKGNWKKPQRSVFLATGSLWYGPNQEGILWLLNYVWPNVDLKNKLIIAGKNPTEEIKDKCGKFSNVILYDTPKNIEPLFQEANYYLAPIFTGAGIKIKVAEAIIHGLPTIGTEHAYIGYAVKNRKSMLITQDADIFAKYINNLGKLDNMEYENLQKDILDLYLSNYSIEIARRHFKQLTNEWMVKKI